MPTADLSATGNRVEVLDDGRLVVGQPFVVLLQKRGLDSFEAVMTCKDGEMMRSVPGRSTVKMELQWPDGAKQIAFLKRYEPEYISNVERLLRLIHWPGAGDEALHEWNAIWQMRASRFNTAVPIAVGQEKHAGIVTRSFLLTAEIVGGIAAHDYTRTLDAKTRGKLAAQIADLTRRFHSAGFAHQDHYLSHIFIVPPQKGGDDSQFFYIDLQRLISPRFLRKRWIVKDLGMLGYSAQLAGATNKDLMRFCEGYFQKKQFSEDERRIIRRVVSRMKCLHRRKPKYDAIWNEPGVRPPNV